MKDLLSPEALSVFLYFVVPGFVALQFYDIIVPSERRNFGESVIQVVSYGLITNVLFFWAYRWALDGLNAPRFRMDHPIAYTLGYVILTALIVFVVPALLAVVVYKSRTGPQGWLNRVLGWFGVQHIPLNPMPTAWDFFFSKKQPCFMIFHMKNGDVIGGGFSENSYASAYPGPQALYVEQLLTVDKDTRAFGQLIKGHSAIIRFEDCDYIEMILQEGTP